MEGRQRGTAELERRAAAAEAALAASESGRTATASELRASRATLESVLSSLDAKKQYDALLRQHESEWLPHWLGERMQHAGAAGAAAARAAGAAVGAACAAAGDAYASRVAPALRGARLAGNKVWQLRLKPALGRAEAALERRAGTAWPKVRGAAGGAAAAVGAAARAGAAAAARRAAQAEEAAERAVLARMRRSPALQPAARQEVVHYALWGLLASLAAPLLYLGASRAARAAAHAVRPGTAEVAPPTVGAALNDVEARLGYSFAQPATLSAAFSDPGGRLAWVGAAAARLLAAEAAYKKQDVGPAAADAGTLQTAADAAVQPAALAAAAERAGLRAHVRAGPGARSVRAAAARAGQLYAACLGAVFVDAEFDLKAARKAFGALLQD
jgi:hypothetical protein